MTKQQTKLEARSYPDVEPISEVDRLMFGPVDPLGKTIGRLFLSNWSLAAVAVLSLLGNGVQYYQAHMRDERVLILTSTGQVVSSLLNSSGFTPHKPEAVAALRKSITDWAEGFYSRLRNPLNGVIATTAYPGSFLFLSSDLAQVYNQRESRQYEIAAFMSSGDSEYKAVVTNVVFRNLERKPYEADIYFDKVYYSQPLVVTAKKSYFVTIQFSANPSEAELDRLRKRANLDIDSVMRTNPLVVAITRLGDEQVFASSQPVQQ